MNKNISRKFIKLNSGLTFLEVLVVIAFIVALYIAVLIGFSSSRTKARDTRRFTDMQNIQFALELFFADNGYYPREIKDNATGRIGEGGKIDLLLLPYTSGMPPADPLGPGDSLHYYYYDGSHACSNKKSQKMAVIFASNIEKVAGNSSNFCANWNGESNTEVLNSWNIVLGKSNG